MPLSIQKNKGTPTFTSLTQLRAYSGENLSAGDPVFYSPASNQSTATRTYFWDVNSTATDDGDITIKLTDTTTGRLVRGDLYNQGGTGAVNQTLETRLANSVYASDYATVQQAIDRASSLGVPCICYGQTFTPTTAIEIPSNSHIIGGTWNLVNNATLMMTNSDTVGGNENITIEDIAVDGDHDSFGSSNGIQFTNVSNITFRNCTIKDAHSSLSGIVKFSPLMFFSCSNVIVTGNRFLESARSGVFITDASGKIVVSSNIIYKVENSGIVIQGTSSDGTDPVESVAVYGNVITDAHNGAYDSGAYTGDQLYNQDGAIDVYQGGNNLSITGNVIDGFGILGNDEQATPAGPDINNGEGIRITQTQGGVVSGNSLVTHSNFDICLYASIRDAVESKGIIFANNTVRVMGEGNRCAVSQQDNVSFIGNHFRDGTGSASADYVFSLRNDRTGCHVLDNVSDIDANFGHIDDDGIECVFSGNRVINSANGIVTDSGNTYDRCVFSGNTITSTAGRGLYLRGTLTNCKANDNVIDGAEVYGIDVSDGDGCQVNGNTVTDSGGHGILFQAGDRSQIQNNSVSASSQGTTATNDNINVTGSNLLVQGNTVYEGSGAAVARYGIRVNAGSTKVAVVNNFVEEGGFSAEISDAGTGTITTSGNIT